MLRPLFIAICTVALLVPPAPPPPPPPQILILGTFHMANPGRDVHNMEADDVLSDRRQAEMAELIDVLERFRPTKVAVESAVGSRTVGERYRAYRAGEYTLTRNETDQIGLRLAAALDLDTVYPVDVDGEFPFYRVQNWAVANGRQEAFDALQAETGASVARQGEYLRTHTLLETLARMNTDSAAAAGVAGYYGFVSFGQPYEYAGPDLLARWFERNIRIYHNIRALVDSPDDRILVLYGAGHLGWLRQNVRDDPGVELRTLGDLIGV